MILFDMSDEIKTYASELLAETREEIVRADTKAAILFTAFGDCGRRGAGRPDRRGLESE